MARIETRLVPSARPWRRTPRQVERAFRRRLADGARLVPLGTARRRPLRLLAEGYAPRTAVALFDTTFYLSGLRQNEDLRFFVAYVAQARGDAPLREIHPRIFYKDVSLVWRSASHYARSGGENWIGKGDVKVVVEDGDELVCSAEETTDLPLELQTALETSSRRARRIPYDDVAVARVLRRAPDDRIAAYRDFTGPRRRAQADPRNRIHGGRPVARFTRRNDPTSLRFAAGFEPDLDAGLLEVASSTSRLYGGRVERFRIASRNRRVQYLFMAGPRQVWIASLQATTTELSSYGVRTVDVAADDDLFVPGYEYHYLDEGADPPVLVSQIPKGYVGPRSTVDPSRSDASPWLDRLPIVRAFRERRAAMKKRARQRAWPARD